VFRVRRRCPASERHGLQSSSGFMIASSRPWVATHEGSSPASAAAAHKLSRTAFANGCIQFHRITVNDREVRVSEPGLGRRPGVQGAE